MSKPVKIIVAKNKLDCSHLLGQFLDESHYDTLIEEDVDVYGPADCEPGIKSECNPGDDCANCSRHNASDELKIIAKFRKNYFSVEEQKSAYEGLRGAAGKSQNRGLAAGPRTAKLNGREWVTPYQLDIIEYFSRPSNTLTGEDPIDEIKQRYATGKVESDNRGIVWKSEHVLAEKFVFNEWVESTRKLSFDEMIKEAERIQKYISETTYANEVFSGVAGWYDRYPRIPYLRSTSYTRDYPELFEKAYPFLQTLNNGFKELMPWRWSNQKKAADKLDPRYLVPGTVFTTITVNKTFRTAAHFDAGDLNTGLSNLLVLSNNGNFTGGYLIAPEYRVAFNVRPGDLLLINNHEVLHGNTPIECHGDAERISVVCYFREGMLTGGSKEYEELRYEFVEQRRLNPEHPLQRKLWNGISEGMWADKRESGSDYKEAKEWYDFLKAKKDGDKFLNDYHPWLKEAFEGVKLDEFFG